MATISPEQLFSFAQSAKFFNYLQNFKYNLGSIGGVANRPGTNFSTNEINSIFSGSYNGEDTSPQLNIGSGESIRSLPLRLFKGDPVDPNTADLDRYLQFFKSEFTNKSTGYIEGDNGNRIVNYYPSYPYISVNFLPSKTTAQWINRNAFFIRNTLVASPVAPDNYGKGAEYVVFNENANPSLSNVQLSAVDLTLGQAILKGNETTIASDANSRIRFRYVSGGGTTYTLSYKQTSKIGTTKTSGLSTTNTSSNTAGGSTTIKNQVEGTGGIALPGFGDAKGKVINSVELSANYSRTWGNTKTVNSSEANTNETVSEQALTVVLNTAQLKEGAPISDGIVAGAGVNVADPNQKLESGGLYEAFFRVSTGTVDAPATGYQTISGSPGTIRPRSIMYQSSGDDYKKFDYENELQGASPQFWGQQFLNYGGSLAFNLDQRIDVNNGNGIDTYDNIKPLGNGNLDVFTLRKTSTSFDYDVVFDIRRITDSQNQLRNPASSALLNLSSVATTSDTALEAQADLDVTGQVNMSDLYDGFDGRDIVDGSEEGDDYAETKGGDDLLTGFNNSFLDTGNGNDTILTTKEQGGNQINTGSGDDRVTLASNANRVVLGDGRDQVLLSSLVNSIDLGQDQDQDVVIASDATDWTDASLNLNHLDLGQDLIVGFAAANEIVYAYDSTYGRITGQQTGSDQTATAVSAWIHPEEDINLNLNDHRLFLQLLSSSDLTAADRVFIETESLSDDQWDAFIQRFVFSDQPLNAADAQSNAFMASELKQLLNNPDLQSLGRAIWEGASSAGESALKALISNKLVDLGIPEAAATVVVNNSWAIVVGLLEQSLSNSNAMATPSDGAFSNAAETFLTELSSRMEESFHAKAFPVEQIDPLTGLAITPSADDNAITGTDRNDWIRAGSGQDQIDSGAGNDAVRAGIGSDLITLGAGADALVISSDQLDGATDTITDFNAAEDRLLLEDGIQIKQLSGDQVRLFMTGASDQEERELTLLLQGVGADLANLNVERFSFG